MRLRLLIVESDAADLLFLESAVAELSERGPSIADGAANWIEIATEHACTMQQAAAILAETGTDAMLLSLPLPDARGVEAYRRLQAIAPQTPVVLLIEPKDRGMALHLIREGVQDFLIKGEIDCGPLAHVFETAVERHRLLSATRAGAITDPLTGLLNRNGFFTMAERDRILAERLGLRILLISGELAQFTPFSPDQDLGLVQAGDHLRSLAGPMGLAGRLADSRFVLMTLESPTESTEAAWARVEASTSPKFLRLGCATCDANNPASLEALLEQAEADLISRAAPRMRRAAAR